MSCQHREDVCQHCLEKVLTTTEDAPPPKRVSKAPTTEKTMTPRQKRISILVDSSLLVAGGAMLYFCNKPILNSAIEIFDSILDTIGTRTRKE